MDDGLGGAAFLIHRLEELVDYLMKHPDKGLLVLGGIVLIILWLTRK